MIETRHFLAVLDNYFNLLGMITKIKSFKLHKVNLLEVGKKLLLYPSILGIHSNLKSNSIQFAHECSSISFYLQLASPHESACINFQWITECVISHNINQSSVCLLNLMVSHRNKQNLKISWKFFIDIDKFRFSDKWFTVSIAFAFVVINIHISFSLDFIFFSWS